MKIFSFLVLSISALLVIGAKTNGGTSAQYSCGDQIGAFVMSQTFVSQKLKAPSTASYPWFTDGAVSVRNTGLECEFVVRAYVDSQNGFGAKIRSNYQIRLFFHKATGEWEASHLYFS